MPLSFRPNVLVAFVFLLVLIACAPSPNLDPRKQPYKLEDTSLSHDANDQLKDLDNDGRYEIIHYFNPPPNGTEQPIGYVQIRSQENRIIEQINFLGIVSHHINYVDIDGDGKIEMAVPLMRNDSLFVGLVDSRGRKLSTFFLTSGKPRLEPDGTMIPWDPAIFAQDTADINHDGKADLVTVMCTSLARSPRGIYIHTLPEGKLLGEYMVGAAIQSAFMGDYDGDGILELVAGTRAYNNGASANGFDDKNSYIIVFKLTLPIQIVWSRKLDDEWSNADLYEADFDSDGKQEFLLATNSAASFKPKTTRMELLEAGSWRTLKRIESAEPVRSLLIMDLNRDVEPEILALSPPDLIRVFDRNFAVRQRRALGLSMTLIANLPDIDGDGTQDVVAPCENGFALLGSDLEIKTVSADELAIVLPANIGAPLDFFVKREGRLHAQRLIKNKTYWLNRYGPATLGALASVVAAGLMIGFIVRRRRSLFTRSVQHAIFKSDSRGLIALDSEGRIVYYNLRFAVFLKSPRLDSLNGLRLPELFGNDALCAFAAACLKTNARHEQSFILPPRQFVNVIVEPLMLKGDTPVYWLIQFIDQAGELESREMKAWNFMAQKVAHDIKSPLTAMMLTLERLQKEYRRRSPEAAKFYDDHVAGVVERMEALRRMTHNFMKLVDAEELKLVEKDFNVFMRRVSEENIKTLPPDIELELKLSAESCALRFDEEQMQEVVENLIANSINAMPEGGKLVLSTQVTRNLQLPFSHGEPRDYVVLEVLDTGFGIPAAIRNRIFEPKFTTSSNGNGLGLAIVKRIVEKHCGHVELESEEGMGTALSVYLPAA